MPFPSILKQLNRAIQSEIAAPAIILMAGLSLRVVMLLGAFGILWPDSFDYYYEAILFLRTHTFNFHRIYHTPLYPLFLSFFLSFFVPSQLFGQKIHC